MTLTPKPLILQGFRVLFFEIDTQIDTESHSSLFPLPQKLPKYKEKLSTEVLNYDSTCIKDRDNLNKIFETMRFLAAKWNDKTPYKELSYKEKFIRFFTHFDKEAFRIYRHK